MSTRNKSQNLDTWVRLYNLYKKQNRPFEHVFRLNTLAFDLILKQDTSLFTYFYIQRVMGRCAGRGAR